MTTLVRRLRRRGEGSVGALVVAAVVLRKVVARMVLGKDGVDGTSLPAA